VVPIGAGGGVDATGRLIAEKLQERLKQPVVVENRPAAGGMVGTDSVAKAAPDGHTLLLMETSAVLHRWLHSNVPYDVVADFAPIARVAISPLILYASPSFGPNDVRELIALAKAQPGKLSAGTPGVGTPHHLGLMMLNALAKIDIVNVPYRGAAAALNDVLAGQIPMSWAAPTAVMPHVATGKVKILGVASAQRPASLPQVPPIAEGGVPGFDLDVWFGVAAPARTPPDVVARLSRRSPRSSRSPTSRSGSKTGLSAAYRRRQVRRRGPRRPRTLRQDHPRCRHRSELVAVQVIIIGGGIAGLSQALSLHQIGVPAASTGGAGADPLGYGINLQPNAIRELSALGLGEKLAAAGILTKELAFYNKHGQLIWTEPRGRAAGYRWPQISISRGELHKILLAAIHERLGADAVVTGHPLTRFEQRGDTVIARFADPSGQPVGEAEGDILIGADGIHSAVRQHFYQGEKAVFDGHLHYRGIVEAQPYHRCVDGGGRPPHPSRHRLSGDAAPGGKVMINWLACTRSRRGRRRWKPGMLWPTRACASIDEGWTYPWLDVHGLFAATPDADVLQLPNVDRDPIPRWSFGRVTLIGDAAHPMQPVGAQAGSQAVVDGRVLAASLMAVRDPVEALTRYQNERIAAMNDMIIRNRNLGLESILQTAEERAPGGFKHIHDVLSQEELEHTATSFKKAAGFDVDTVNSRESFVDVASG
jgi:tripartite-type tricarboxylate transporter receptor subunit TctC/2-polyprenyl-6-methoxyphenol hydroxylase-like FAD-dependent oxidoreductase